jgi:glycosyltransferase involved in cell wall biosynthesis
MTKKKISIVTPFYNEEKAIAKYLDALSKAFAKINDISYEIIAVDDGSSDETFALLKEQAEKKNNIKIIKLSRNFGKEIALSAGIDYAFGDAVIPMDADLQDDPKVIVQMIEKWREGYKVVLGERISRNDPIFKKITAAIFYKLAAKIMDKALPRNVGDFRLMDKVVVDEVRKMREKNRFMRGILSWTGYKTTIVKFERSARLDGKTKYNYKSVIKYALDGIFSFSTFPIRLITYCGLLMSAFSFLYGLFIVIEKLVFNQGVPGYASIMSVILFVSGINFIFIGVIGEYVGRIFNEVKERPLYIVEEVVE